MIGYCELPSTKYFCHVPATVGNQTASNPEHPSSPGLTSNDSAQSSPQSLKATEKGKEGFGLVVSELQSMCVLTCPVAKACSETEHHGGRSMWGNLLTSQKSGSQGRQEERPADKLYLLLVYSDE